MRTCIAAACIVFTPIVLSALGPSESVALPGAVPGADQPSAGAGASIRIHAVESGEDLYTIAMMYGVSVDRLKEVNELTGTCLTGGQQVRIPIDDPPAAAASSRTEIPLKEGVRRNRFGCSRW